MITNEEWGHLPQTKLLITRLKENIQDMQDAWMSRQYVGDTVELTAQLNNINSGKAEALTTLLNMIIEITEDTEENAEASRPQGSY